MRTAIIAKHITKSGKIKIHYIEHYLEATNSTNNYIEHKTRTKKWMKTR